MRVTKLLLVSLIAAVAVVSAPAAVSDDIGGDAANQVVVGYPTVSRTVELRPGVTLKRLVVENDRHYYPRLRVETWNGSAWIAGAKQDGSTYTATDSERVRLAYTWERDRGSMVIVW